MSRREFNSGGEKGFDKMKQHEHSAALLNMMKETNNLSTPRQIFLWKMGLLKLRQGKHAQKFQAKHANSLYPQMLLKQMIPNQGAVWPLMPARDGILVGRDAVTGQPDYIDINDLTCSVFLCGTNGCGKTSLEAIILSQLPHSVLILGVDSKNEIIRMRNLLSGLFLYITPKQLYRNILEPIGPDPELYWAGLFEMLAPILGLDSKTWPEIVGILKSVLNSLPPGEFMISWSQFIRILDKHAKKMRKKKYSTAADRLRILERAYGECARVRSAPSLYERYRVIGMNYAGCSHQDRHATEGATLYSLMQQKSISGHNSDLSVVYTCDESLDDFSKQYSSREGRATLQEIFFSQSRSFGIGKINLFQYATQAHTCVTSNSVNIFIMRTPDPSQARLAVRMLNLTDDYIDIIRTLPVGEAFHLGPGYPLGRRIITPLAELNNYPSSAEISTMMDAEVEWMRSNSTFSPEEKYTVDISADYLEMLGYEKEEEPPPVIDEESDSDDEPVELFEEHIKFLEEIVAHPESSITEHYKEFGGSVRKAQRIKDHLLDNGLIVLEKRKIINGRPKDILRATNRSKSLLQ